MVHFCTETGVKAALFCQRTVAGERLQVRSLNARRCTGKCQILVSHGQAHPDTRIVTAMCFCKRKL